MSSQPVIESNGIFGVYGQAITDSFAFLLGQVVGTRIASGRVIVGGDTRSSTPALKESLIAGVLSTGCEVYDVGILPIPALFFAKDRFWGDAAVMVTGSHRPIQENGFKVTLGKLPPTAVDMQEMIEMIQAQGPFSSGSGQLYIQNTLEPYASFLVARFVPADPLRVVIDAGNGTMRGVAVPILLSLGYEVTERTFDSESLLMPDPTWPENQAVVSKAVLDNQAHLGVAYDGDGDRVVFFSEQGRVLPPEQVLILLACALLSHQPGSQVVYEASCGAPMASRIRKMGGTPVPVDLASTELKRAFFEKGAILGGDGRGHYFFRAMGGDDALYATLVLLRLIAPERGVESLLADYA